MILGEGTNHLLLRTMKYIANGGGVAVDIS